MSKDAFFKELNDCYMRNPFMPLEHIIGKAIVQLQSTSVRNQVELAFIKSLESRGGHASRALDAVGALADKHNITIELFVIPLKGCAVARKAALNKKELLAWYARHKFVLVEGTGYMRRTPQGENHGLS